MNEKIKVLLVDDEKDSREVMAKLLSHYFSEIEIVGQANSAEAAYASIVELKPDLVFLDIQMPKANGFSLLKRFAEIPFEVIFVTSFDQYAVNAIKFSALDYLLKPVEIADLREAVAKAIKIIGKKQSSSLQVINLLHGLEDNVQEKKIAVHAGDKVRFIPSGEVVYIEADGRYCRIFTKSVETYVTAKYLKDFEAYFGDDSAFVRISKTYLLNTAHIESYSKGDPCIIQMVTGNCFEASRRKKQEVLEKLQAK
ncbi:LytR/AlgR family response regulator transcription factor [Flavobacterium sp.]|uniref:LytR/AlgR family response regulator transcription factor n=1 Tax=Flavobacterium sp. TaxID=239 RepID=UPI0039E2C053